MNRPIRQLATLATLMFIVLMVAATSIQFIQAPALNADARNARTLYREFGTERGPIIVSGESIAVSAPNDGLYEFQREYRDDGAYSHVTGYFSTVFNSMTGIEKAENSVLGGSDSSLAGQRLQDLITGSQPQGGAVELTLDDGVQQAAIDAMAGRRGAVVALDPKTGAVLAQVSLPTYDANTIATQDSAAAQEAWTALSEDPEKPLVDRTSGGDQYPPGSIFKMLTAVAMLENTPGLTPDTLVDAPTSWSPPGTSHEIWNPGQAACGDGSGQTSLRQTFVQSCNTAYAIGGVDVGADKMIAQAESFGFGETFHTPLTVSPSRFPEPESQAALAMDSFGQQDIMVTPMQMAMIASAIANDGVLMEPYIVKQTLTADLEPVSTTKPSEYSRPMSEQTAAYMQQMMVDDVVSGTGYLAAIDGVDVAGKTGTAELTGSDRHAWFAAFAPADDPQIAVVVILENDPGDGGSSAAPVAREIIRAKLGL